MKRIIAYAALLLLSLTGVSATAGDNNFANRRAHIINNCPYVELSNFSYYNIYLDRADRFLERMEWKNVGTQPLVAFEVVILKYDAFDQRLTGSRWTVAGIDSTDWSPLQPGQSGSDGTRSYGSEKVFTGIAYVRSARLLDGTVWHANELEILKAVKQLQPDIKDVGSLKPDPIPPAQKP